MNIIATDVQRLEQDALVTLFEVDLEDKGMGVVRMCEGSPDGNPLVFDGYSYHPVPLKAEGFKMDSQGTLPAPTLTFSVMTMAFASLMRDSDNFVGAPVKRIRTYRRYLDDGESPDPSARLPDDNFVVERKDKHNSSVAVFELSVSFDQRGTKIPGRQVLRDFCSHKYRVWKDGYFSYTNVTCPYTREVYYDAKGNKVTTADKDSCGKTLKDCEKRFGKNSELPFYGFPGVGRV